MPIYEYRCKKCGYKFEELVLPGEKEPEKCPKCGGELERLFGTGVGFIFKGSGFYITDYKRKEAQSGHEKASNGSKSNKKSDKGKSESK